MSSRDEKLTSAIDGMTMIMADLAKEVRDMRQDMNRPAAPEQPQPPRMYMVQGGTVKPVEEVISGIAYRDLSDSPRPDEILRSDDLKAATNAIGSTDLNGAFSAMVMDPKGGGGVGTIFFGSDDMYKVTKNGSIVPFHPNLPVVIGPMKEPTGVYVPFALSEEGRRMVSDLGYILYDRAPTEPVKQMAPSFPVVVQAFCAAMED